MKISQSHIFVRVKLSFGIIISRILCVCLRKFHVNRSGSFCFIVLQNQCVGLIFAEFATSLKWLKIDTAKSKPYDTFSLRVLEIAKIGLSENLTHNPSVVSARKSRYTVCYMQQVYLVIEYLNASNYMYMIFLTVAYNLFCFSYCTNISFYMMLKSKQIPVHNHPVIKRLVQYRNVSLI